ncbi:MAG: transcriptional regulator [Candidatus Riflebacteria bacterium GWC2_50_8]|nr:MAG: transcriptional regulator [Candidatus Riflebacteria bacterium GWC2_50_8]
MPELARFFGIIIVMYYDDHDPPHFHAKYGDMRACFSIAELRIIEGELPKRVTAMVLEWAFEHRKELLENWEFAKNRVALKKITPLE